MLEWQLIMTKKPIVLIDMDGVLADFDGATIAHLQSPGVNIPTRPRKNFYYRDDYDDRDHINTINTLHTSQYFFRNLPLVEGALEGWRRVEELGYQPRICSSPLHSNEWCVEEKLAWIEQHFGEAVMRDAIIDSNKELYDGIALIDDRPILKNTAQATWQHIVFDTSYNQDTPTTLRLQGWDDPNLPELLARCHSLHGK